MISINKKEFTPMGTEFPNNHHNGKFDHRYFPRWEVTNRVSYMLEHDLKPQTGYTVDLSCAGARITVNRNFPPNQKIDLTIYLARGKIASVKGTVVWIRKENGKQQAGVDFSETSPDMQDLILQHAFELNRKEVVDHWFKGWDGNK